MVWLKFEKKASLNDNGAFCAIKYPLHLETPFSNGFGKKNKSTKEVSSSPCENRWKDRGFGFVGGSGGGFPDPGWHFGPRFGLHPRQRVSSSRWDGDVHGICFFCLVFWPGVFFEEKKTCFFCKKRWTTPCFFWKRTGWPYEPITIGKIGGLNWNIYHDMSQGWNMMGPIQQHESGQTGVYSWHSWRCQRYHLWIFAFKGDFGIWKRYQIWEREPCALSKWARAYQD